MDRARPDSEALLSQAGWLRKLALHLVRDPDRAEDLVQETWRRALERPAATGGPAGARAWLARVMRNLASNKRRDENLRSWHERAASRDEAWTPEQSEDRVLLQRRLVDAVLELPEPHRSAIVLRYFEGLSPHEVADRLKISQEAARQRISRGLASLRTRLDREHGDDRAAWCLAFVRLLDRPVAPASALLAGGGILMSTKVMALLGAVVVIALASLGVRFASQSDPAGPQLVAPRSSTVLDSSVDSDPAARSARTPELAAAPLDTRSTAPVIDRERDLNGVVLAPSGDPVPRALVEVFRDEHGEFGFLDDRSYVRTKVAETASDEEGRFAIRLGVGKPFVVDVTARGYACERIGFRYAGENMVIPLHLAASLRGRVVSDVDKKPVSGVCVKAYPVDRELVRTRVRFECRTDGQGRFQFDALAPAEYYAYVEPELGWTSLPQQRFDLRGGEVAEAEFHLKTGVTVRGRVVDATTGIPIAHAEVSRDRSFGTRTARTDATGEYEYRGISLAGAFDLYARAPGYGRKELRARDGQGDPLPDHIDFELLPGRSAHGFVVDENGQPISEAYVAAVMQRDSGRATVLDWIFKTTEADGKFVLDDLRADAPHTLLVRKEGFGVVVLEFPESESREVSIDLGRVVIPPPSILEGVVVDDSGVGIPDLPISLEGWNSDRFHYRPYSHASFMGGDYSIDRYIGHRQGRTDHLGRFAFGDLSEGDYRALAMSMGGEVVPSENIQVPRAGRSPYVRIVLKGSHTIAGRVLDPEGRPVPKARVRVREGNDRSAGCETDRDGRFLLRGLEAGCFRLRAQASPWSFAEGGENGAAPAELPGVSSDSVDVEIRLRRPAWVSGTLLDDVDQPISDSWVSAEGPIHGWTGSSKSDISGRFRILVGEGDVVELKARHPPWKPGVGPFEPEARVSRIAAGDDSVVIRLRREQ